MRTKTEQESDDGLGRARAERPVRYRLLVVIVSLMVAAGMVGTTVVVLTILGSLMR